MMAKPLVRKSRELTSLTNLKHNGAQREISEMKPETEAEDNPRRKKRKTCKADKDLSVLYDDQKNQEHVPVPLRQIMQPVQVWTYPDLKVQPSKGGSGVFARTLIPANTVIQYHGKKLTDKQYERLDGSERYLLDAGMGVVDATPSLNPWKSPDGMIGMEGKAIAGLINEPSPDETTNCHFVAETIDGKKEVCVIVTTPISPGQELLIDYGDEYAREYKIGKCEGLPDWFYFREKV